MWPSEFKVTETDSNGVITRVTRNHDTLDPEHYRFKPTVVKPITPDQQSAQFAFMVYQAATPHICFGKENNLTAEQISHQVSRSVVKLILEGSETTPPFDLCVKQPVPSAEGADVITRQYKARPNMDPDVYLESERVAWPYGEKASITVEAFEKAHSTIYDEARDRLSISAKDLFS